MEWLQKLHTDFVIKKHPKQSIDYFRFC